MQLSLPKFTWSGFLFIAIVAGYLFGKMFYIAERGGAQPADITLAVAFLLLITPWALARLGGVNPFLVALMSWAVLVNLGWAVSTGNGEFLTSASYYAFNFGVVAAVFWTRQRNPRLFDFVILATILVSVVTQGLAASLLSGGYRSAGTFGNPNQLAFWAVCVGSIWVLIRPRRVGLLDLAVIGALAWIELNSLSRAGMGALIILVALWLWRSIRTWRARLAAFAVVAAAGAALALTPMVAEKLSRADLVAKAEARIQKQRSMGELEYRGYDRIVEFTGHIIVGAGEGATERFTGYDRDLELHSTLGTLLFSYGILGIALFFGFLWRLTRTVSFDRYIYLVPALAYGATHNGLRFSFFWFMLAILLSFAVTEGRRVAPKRRAAPPPRPVYGDHAPVSARGPVGGG